MSAFPILDTARAAFLAALALAVTCWPGRASADDADEGAIDDLDLVKLLNVEVSTATKTAESLDDAPAVITVVTREDIQRWGYQSVAEVLAHTVGFYVIDDHILPNAAVRGMSGGLGAESGAIKVMIDGRSVAYRTTSGNWLGVELIPLESVAQIEIIRGPASALYGADAFLGVVNIITLPPEDLRPVRARLSAGLTRGNPGGQFDVVSGGVWNRFDWMVGAAGEYTDRSGLTLPSESPAPILPSYVGSRRTALNLERRSLVLQSRFGYRGDSGHLVLSAYASGLERGGDFAHWAQLTNDPSLGSDVGTRVALGQLRINLDGQLDVADELTLALQSTYFRGGVLPADRVEIASESFYVERSQAYSGVDSVFEARWVPSSRLNAIVGVETVYDREELPDAERIDRSTGQSLAIEQSPGRADHVPFVNVGAYASVNFKLLDPWLKLTGGLRYDDHSEYGSQLTGRVGVTSRWSRTLVTKLLYGSAFKAPSPYLIYADPLRPGDVIGNRRLKPQYIHTLEYQMTWKPTRFFGVTSGVSHSWLLDKAEFTSQGINQTARNVASQRSLSWETRVDFRHYDDYNVYGSAELVRSRRDLGQEGYAAQLVGDKNVVYPPWIVRGGSMVSLPSLPSVPLQLGAEAIIVGPRRAADTSIVERGEDFSLPAYALVDLSLATREVYLAPGHETRFALRSRNLLAAEGPDPGFSGFEYPLAPARIFFEIEHTY